MRPLTEVCAPGEITQLVAGKAHACGSMTHWLVYCWGLRTAAERGKACRSTSRDRRPSALHGCEPHRRDRHLGNARGSTRVQHAATARGLLGTNDDGRCGSDAPNPALRALRGAGITGGFKSARHDPLMRWLTGGEVYCWGNTPSQLVIGSTTPSASAHARCNGVSSTNPACRNRSSTRSMWRQA